MKSIFSFYVMKHFAYANSITCGNNSSFIKFIIIFSLRYLRTHKKWIQSVFYCFICITATSADICNIL